MTKTRKRNNRRKETYCNQQRASCHRTTRRRADDIVAADRHNANTTKLTRSMKRNARAEYSADQFNI